ncbi:carboxymuconolactone decarboxylase family protein [Cupriavidus sp. AcVe19-1a]|uniref:carboxymuconolactone decarboxylase family protein n=1 Tax=Cupriavidus sp. AcVe19-1a TaxID=2821359 RepID=UPI001FD84F31|nr:carboxymuconolactone decarboxylase family protein [Cupriavidus sp. AcVe19-1a]
MKDLARLRKLDEKAPEAMKSFRAFDQAVLADGALSVQQKQIIAVAVALTTQCPWCIACIPRPPKMPAPPIRNLRRLRSWPPQSGRAERAHARRRNDRKEVCATGACSSTTPPIR